jgi:hypothetical protein
MYKCRNTECIIETLSKDVDNCPVCNSVVEPESPEPPEPPPSMTLEEAESERRYWLAIEAEERRMYGDAIEDFESQYRRPTLRTNEAGEPVRWD